MRMMSDIGFWVNILDRKWCAMRCSCRAIISSSMLNWLRYIWNKVKWKSSSQKLGYSPNRCLSVYLLYLAKMANMSEEGKTPGIRHDLRNSFSVWTGNVWPCLVLCLWPLNLPIETNQHVYLWKVTVDLWNVKLQTRGSERTHTPSYFSQTETSPLSPTMKVVLFVKMTLLIA